VYYFSSGKFGKNSPANTPYPDFTIDDTGVEVYFAPEDHAGYKIINEIEKANKSIYFATFCFTHEEIAQAIIDRNKTGVVVKGIFESGWQTHHHNEQVYQNMTDNGISVIWDESPELMHHKVFIIDNNTVITGSFNPSANADTKNDENVLIVHSKDIATTYLDEFDKMWDEWADGNDSSVHIVINEVELNSPEDDRLLTTMEWVELYNPTPNDVDISGWHLRTTGGDTETFIVPSDTIIPANGYFICERSRWLDNNDESLILYDSSWDEVDRSPVRSDNDNDDNSWQRYPNGIDTNTSSDWTFKSSTKGYSNGGEPSATRSIHTSNDCVNPNSTIVIVLVMLSNYGSSGELRETLYDGWTCIESFPDASVSGNEIIFELSGEKSVIYHLRAPSILGACCEINGTLITSDSRSYPVVGESTVCICDCGDVNLDSIVNLTDVILLLNHLGYPAAHAVDEVVADVNCDGKINMGDVVLLLNHVIDPDRYELGCCGV